MLYALCTAALAFSAPPSMTRRDVFVAFGGAAAAMAPLSPAFAENKYAGSADRKKAAKYAALPIE